MKLASVIVLLVLQFSSFCKAEEITYYEVSLPSGEIRDSADYTGLLQKKYIPHHRGWIIKAPDDGSLKIFIDNMLFSGLPCSQAYINVTVVDTKQRFEFCDQDVHKERITAHNDVIITYFHGSELSPTSFTLEYRVERKVSNIKGLDASLKNAVSWLKDQRSSSLGWGKETPRAITALYLSGVTDFHGQDLEDELMVNQLELETALALLRNSTDPLTITELSMFVNALRITCHNPRNFYGYDLLKILTDRVATTSSPSPIVYLTMCSSNLTVTDNNIKSLLNILQKHSGHPFHTDLEAMAVIALSCIKRNTGFFVKDVNSSKVVDTSVHKFMSSQLPDGTFGNIYTTALITQAIISNGQEHNKSWDAISAVKSLMKWDSSSMDLISASLILPVFNGKNLADISSVECKRDRKQDRDNKISDVLSKVGERKQIQYTLYVGDNKDVTHTIYLKVPVSSTAYDVMKLAADVDPKYKFNCTDVSGHTYVYRIAGISNDPQTGKFWLLHISTSGQNAVLAVQPKSPEEVLIKDTSHLVMWYKIPTI